MVSRIYSPFSVQTQNNEIINKKAFSTNPKTVDSRL